MSVYVVSAQGLCQDLSGPCIAVAAGILIKCLNFASGSDFADYFVLLVVLLFLLLLF